MTLLRIGSEKLTVNQADFSLRKIRSFEMTDTRYVIPTGMKNLMIACVTSRFLAPKCGARNDKL